VTVCLARVKKRHKCKFVPRLLSMIIGDPLASLNIIAVSDLTTQTHGIIEYFFQHR